MRLQHGKNSSAQLGTSASIDSRITSRRRNPEITTYMAKAFTITRSLNATAQQVWHAWTDPDAIADWWHPRNTSTPREEVKVDVRVGGHYRYTMVNDDTGERVVTGGVYKEVAP